MAIMVIVCTRCKQEKSFDEMTKDKRRKAGHGSWCKQCNREWQADQDRSHVTERHKKWREQNPEAWKRTASASARRQHEAAKRAVVDAYGGRCTCCGETDIHFLTVEHMTVGSRERHRYDNGKRISGTKLLRLIASEGFPDDITVMCFNCNCARGQYGFCPHEHPDNPFMRRYVDVRKSA